MGCLKAFLRIDNNDAFGDSFKNFYKIQKGFLAKNLESFFKVISEGVSELMPGKISEETPQNTFLTPRKNHEKLLDELQK